MSPRGWLRGYRSIERPRSIKPGKTNTVFSTRFANSRFQTRQAADTWMCTRIYLFTYLYIVPYLYLCVISNVCSCPSVLNVRVHHMHVYCTSILVVYNEFHSTRIASILIERTSQPSIVVTVMTARLDHDFSPFFTFFSSLFFPLPFHLLFTTITKQGRTERCRSADRVVEKEELFRIER